MTRRRSGFSAVYVVLFLIVLFAFVSFAVDVGRVRLARAQLQTAADAAARAGASALPDGPSSEAEDRAVDFASQNKCLDTAVAITASDDVELGVWDEVNRTFTTLIDDPGTLVDERRHANACKVTARRTTDRDNPIDLTFARVIGKDTFNVETVAIAYIKGRRRQYGLVGLDFIRMTGTTHTDSYDGNNETYPGADGTPNNHGTISSNGDITLNGTVNVHGDAYPGYPNHIVDKTQNVTITGDWHTPLDEPLVFPAETVPGTLANLGNVDLKNQQSLTLTGSTDPAHPKELRYGNFTTRGGSSLIINGYVKLYVTGSLSMAGNTTMNSPAKADKLTISMTSASTSATISGTSSLYVHLYAPLTAITINGTPGFYGWVIGKSLTMLGNSAIHYDETLDGPSGPYTITLVK